MLTPEIEERARQLADEIKAQRKGLDEEDAQAAGVVHRSYARAKKYRDQDRAKLRGMVIAISFMLGRPNDVPLAEEFITDSDVWRAML